MYMDFVCPRRCSSRLFVSVLRVQHSDRDLGHLVPLDPLTGCIYIDLLWYEAETKLPYLVPAGTLLMECMDQVHVRGILSTPSGIYI